MTAQPEPIGQHPGLIAVLEESRELGFLGQGPIGVHIRHSLAMAVVLDGLVGGRHSVDVLDLGAGGGVPGLVMALARPHWAIHLLDASSRRCTFLAASLATLGIEGRVRVVQGRAEELGRDPLLRGRFDAVVARSFAAPSVTAECGRGFLDSHSWMVVAEPPEGAERRWGPGLAELALEDMGRCSSDGFSFQALHTTGPCPDRYPRRNGVPAKRPLF